VELDCGASGVELRRTKILEPKLRALHAIERALRTVGKRHGGALRAVHREIAGHEDIAQESASKGDVVSGLADDADVVGRKSMNPAACVEGPEEPGAVGRRPEQPGAGKVGTRRSLIAGHALDADAYLRQAEDARPGISSAVDAGKKDQGPVNLLRLAIDADVV